MTMNEERAVYYFTAFKGFRRGPVCVIGGKTSRGGRGLKKRKRKKKKKPRLSVDCPCSESFQTFLCLQLRVFRLYPEYLAFFFFLFFNLNG